jgi:hypothetical protein
MDDFIGGKPADYSSCLIHESVNLKAVRSENDQTTAELLGVQLS